MTTLFDQNVGRLWVPERTSFLPGKITSVRNEGHIGIVSYSVRDGRTGRKTQAAYGAGIAAFEGLRNKWYENEIFQRLYKTPDEFIADFGRMLRGAGIVGNERVDNGGNMVSKSFWGSTATVGNATVNAPTRIALCNLVSFAAAHGDESLGSATQNVTTNEWTTNGLGRTGALTPGGLVAPSALDGQFTLTLTNTYTDATGASTVYGAALFDNTTAASNMYAEATFTSATLQINDTLNVTWTCKD